MFRSNPTRKQYVGAAVFMLLANTAHAQNTLPDWSGVWSMQGGTVFDRATQTGEGGTTTPGVREHPPYNAEYEAKYLANLALRDEGILPDPNSFCGIPTGFPRILNLPDVYEFAVTPTQVWIISENGPNVMRIYTDGREHPAAADMWPTHTGDSVGHWEGDTLVFDTLSLHSSDSGQTLIDRTGLTLSDAAHVVTRMHINAEGIMEAQMTIDDAKALTAPWVVTKVFRKLDAGTRVYDYACNENNRNPVDPQTGWTYTIGPDGRIMDRPDANSAAARHLEVNIMRKICARLLQGCDGAGRSLHVPVFTAQAHHSDAMFNRDEVKELSGTVKEFQFTNPHTWVQLNVADAGGQVVEWSFEWGSPNQLGRQGIRPSTFTAGAEVTIRTNPMRDGTPGGAFIGARFADGTTVGRWD